MVLAPPPWKPFRQSMEAKVNDQTDDTTAPPQTIFDAFRVFGEQTSRAFGIELPAEEIPVPEPSPSSSKFAGWAIAILLVATVATLLVFGFIALASVVL